MPFTREQFNLTQQEAEPIINSLMRKEALLLAQQLESQVAGAEIYDPELFQAAQKLIAKLKWVACPLIKDDREFFKLVRENFLEGLELETGLETEVLSYLVSEKLALQFGIGLSEMLRGMLQALRENNQPIGANPIMVKNETQPVRPIIRHWLIDFLRNTPSENPAEVDESNYLFNNPNAKVLAEADKRTLGKVLAFYNTFRTIAQELAQREREQMIVPPTEEPSPPAPGYPQIPATPSGPPQAFPPPPAPPSSPPSLPTAPPSAPAQTPPALPDYQTPPQPPPSYQPPPKKDTYREPIAEEDIAGPARPPARPAPRLDGNIVDLKNINE